MVPLEIRAWTLTALLTLLLLGWVSVPHARAACEGECTQEQAETGLANPPAWAAEREIHFEAESPEASAYTASEMEAGESEAENQVGPLPYHESGKGVQHAPKVYVIFWGKNFTTGETGKEVHEMILNLLKGLTGSAYQGLLTQYFDSTGRVSSTASVTAWTDEGETAPKEVNQVKVEEEIEHAITEQKWTVEPTAQFLLVSAPGSTYKTIFALTKGCAYHAVTIKSTNVTAGTVYSFVPYQGDPPYSETNCIAVGNPSENPVFKTSKSVAHEYAETATDPFPSLEERTYTWRDNTKTTFPEIADLCQLEADIKLPSGAYAQNLYDDHLHGCSHSDLNPPHAYAITEPASGVSKTEATLHGKVNAEGVASEYYFEYGTTKAYGTKTAKISAGSGVADQKVSQALSSLSPSTTYDYRVVTTNSTGTTSGLNGKFTTGSGAAPTVATESATGVTATEAILHGTVNPNGLATTDQFEYGLTESYGSSTPSESAGSGVAEIAKGYILTHLMPNTAYHFRLKASNSSGSSPGTDASFTTEALKPTHATSVGSLGGENGKFAHPAGIASDAGGNIWVVDMNNDRLQKFDREGKYLAKFGKSGRGECQLRQPRSVVIDSEGYLWVDDAGNDRIEKFNEAGECFLAFGKGGTGEGAFLRPEGIAIDAKGNIWVADTYNGRLQEFSHEGKLIKVVQPAGGKSGHMENPSGINIDPEGNLWVVDWAANRVIEFNGEGSFVREFGSKGAGEVQFEHPDAISVDANGCVWIGDEGNDRIQVLTEGGGYITKFGSKGSGAEQFDFEYPMGILANGSGEVWITDARNNRMSEWTIPSLKLTYSSSFGSKGTGVGQFEGPTGIAVNPINGNVVVSDEENARVEVFSQKGEYLTEFGKAGSAEGEFKSPKGLAIDSKGNVWVTDTGNDRVQEFNEEGGYVAQFGTEGSGNGQFISPKALAIDSKGNIWVADSGNSRVEEFNEKLEYQRKFSAGKNPTGVAIDSKGNVWSDNDNETGAIEEHTATGELIRQIVLRGEGIGRLLEPKRLAIGPRGELWIPDAGNNRVEVFNQKGEYVTKFGSAGPGKEQMEYPVGLALDQKGNVWITDENNRVDRWVR
jgi:sugar lactone lactonase YvrE